MAEKPSLIDEELNTIEQCFYEDCNAYIKCSDASDLSSMIVVAKKIRSSVARFLNMAETNVQV